MAIWSLHVHPPSLDQNSEKGFSLLELLAAMTVMLCTTAAAFALFHRSERLFHDHAIFVEMQQTARLVVSQVLDDVRMAGQAIPRGLTDVILVGSGGSRLNIRMGYTVTESAVTSALPLSLTLGVPFTVAVDSTSGFSANRQAFVWSDTDWARITINSVSGSAKTVRGTPVFLSKSPMSFLVPPAISTDEAVSIYSDVGSQVVRRTTTTNTENPDNPVWAPANELATHVTDLTFSYFDEAGLPVAVDTPEHRSRVAAIEVRVAVQASAPLRDGSRPTYSLSVRVSPRNLNLQ